MKKFYFSLLSLALAVTAQAQRTIQVQVKVNDPVPMSELNIISSTIINHNYTITNIGADTIRAGDTIFFRSTGMGVSDTLRLYYAAPIPPSYSIQLNPVVMGPNWVCNYDSVKSLYQLDLTKKVLSKPFALATKYAWYGQVIGIVPKQGPSLSTIFFNKNGSLDTVHVWIDKNNTSIGEFGTKNEVLTTFPNPAKNQVSFNFGFTGTSNATATVMDAFGRTVMIKEIENKGSMIQQYDLDLNGLSSGQYFLRLNAGEKTVAGKFTVQK